MSGWTIDMDAFTVQHETGLTLQFIRGAEAEHWLGSLQSYPKDITPLQLSRLIREAQNEFRKASEGLPGPGLDAAGPCGFSPLAGSHNQSPCI